MAGRHLHKLIGGDWNRLLLFHINWDFIVPIDFHIFEWDRRVGIPPTRQLSIAIVRRWITKHAQHMDLPFWIRFCGILMNYPPVIRGGTWKSTLFMGVSIWKSAVNNKISIVELPEGMRLRQSGIRSNSMANQSRRLWSLCEMTWNGLDPLQRLDD